MRSRLRWGIAWRAGIVAAGAFAFACQTYSEGYEVAGPVHVATVYVDVPLGLNGGTLGDQTPSAAVTWDCQCLGTNYQPDGALRAPAMEVMDALAQPWIRVVLTKIVQECTKDSDPTTCLETIVNTDAGDYAFLNFKGPAKNVISLTSQSGMTDVPLAGFYNSEGSPVTLPPGPSLAVQPVSPLVSGSAYTLKVSRLVGKDDSAAFYQPKGQTFPAGSSVFTTTFQVQGLAVIPGSQMPADMIGLDAGGSANASLNTAVSVAFTGPIDMTSLTATSAFIIPTGGTTPVAGTWTVMGATVTFNSAMAMIFAPNTTYEVHFVKGMVKDVSGGALAQDYVGKFTTIM